MLEAIVYLIIGSVIMVETSLYPRPRPNFIVENDAITWKGAGEISPLVVDGAFSQLSKLFSGPLEVASKNFGELLVINDAITRIDTERTSPTSQHHFGKAVDINTSGMSNEKKLRLLKSLQDAGFNGFGFDDLRGFLHADLRNEKAGWAYNDYNKVKQTEWAGRKIINLILENRNR